MPGISGIDILKKTKDLCPKTDILVISAWDSEAIAEEALQDGAIDYIPKPSTPEVILEDIARILKKRNKYLPKESSHKQ